MKLILGSKSPGRKRVLSSMGYEFTVLDPNIDEKAIREDDPCKLVLLLARAKAAALLKNIHEESLLITADQVVRCHNKILEKPHNHSEAAEFLRLQTQYPAETITAVVVTNTKTLQQASGVDCNKVFFKKIPEEIIQQISSQEYVLHCAGGFTLEDPLIRKYIDHIEGTEDSVTGLPMELTKKLLVQCRSD